jgi:hypothetical protein
MFEREHPCRECEGKDIKIINKTERGIHSTKRKNDAK